MKTTTEFHKVEMAKLEQIFKEKKFTYGNELFILDVPKTMTYNRMKKIRPKAPFRYLLSNVGEMLAVFASEKCTVRTPESTIGALQTQFTPIGTMEDGPPAPKSAVVKPRKPKSPSKKKTK